MQRRSVLIEFVMTRKDESKAQRESMVQTQSTAPTAPRMQQLLHGLRLSASDDLAPASELECLARLIESRRHRRERRRA